MTDGTSIHTTDYLDGFQYYGVTSSPAVLQFFPHAEGYVKQTTLSMLPTFDYVYNYTDHLGNIRLSYAKDPSTGDVKILEENHYYPFGLKHQKYTNPQPKDILANEDETSKIIGPGDPSTNILPFKNYDYKYNGKELQDELGLNMYDMDMRMYEPSIARWVVMDPVIHHSMSPYNAFDNNPVFWADPSGAEAVSSDTGSDSGTGVSLAFGVSLDSVMATSAVGFTSYADNSSDNNKKKGDPESRKERMKNAINSKTETRGPIKLNTAVIKPSKAPKGSNGLTRLQTVVKENIRESLALPSYIVNAYDNSYNPAFSPYTPDAISFNLGYGVNTFLFNADASASLIFSPGNISFALTGSAGIGYSGGGIESFSAGPYASMGFHDTYGSQSNVLKGMGGYAQSTNATVGPLNINYSRSTLPNSIFYDPTGGVESLYLGVGKPGWGASQTLPYTWVCCP